MKIYEITDPTIEFKRLKGELERLRAADPTARWVEYLKSHQDSKYEDPAYQQKEQLFKKLKKIYYERWKKMQSRLDRLKGEILHQKHRDQPTGMFVKYDTVPGVVSPVYIDQLGQLIDQQNENLDGPAAWAIDAFVGHTHGHHTEGIGVMDWKPLEDAFSDSPSPRGIEARRDLERGMEPIKAALRARFGDTIYLYRSQEPLKTQSHRNVLSWTASQKFANYHGGKTFNKIEAVIPVDDIVWITDRANQQEFICMNRRGNPHYLGLS
jgi:hypothetical protein